MTGPGYHVDVALRWSDMDAYRHVNNVVFLRLLEDARVSAFADWFGRAKSTEDKSMLETGVLVARHEIEYLAPLAFRHLPVRVALWPTAIGGASFDIAYEVRDPEGAGEGVYARAETTLVAYDFTTSAPRRLSAQERAMLAAHAAEPVSFRWRTR